jgi:ABC-type multidrug transport system fused ATPase/permease subunit
VAGRARADTRLFHVPAGVSGREGFTGCRLRLEGALFKRIERLSFSYYDRVQAGQLVSRLTSDVEQIRTFAGSGIVQLANAGVMLIGTTALLLYLDWRLALVALAIVPIIAVLLVRFVGRIRPLFREVRGAVRLDGNDVRDVTLSSLRSQIGIVLQETRLFSGTVRENVAFGRPDATDEEVVAAAEVAQAGEFIRGLSDGYDTVIGERGIGLSGGQRQRIVIARALLIDPRLLILDDSTSAVDAETEAAIQETLDRLMREKHRTVFVIAQRISTVRDADLILVLDEGSIAASGIHEEFLRESELYNEILGSQLLSPSETAA